MSIEKEFVRFNETINREIIQNPDFVKATASGRMRDSVLNNANVTIAPNRFIKKVLGYAEFIDDGRGKYRGGGNSNLWGQLYEWVGYKKYNINWNTQQDRERVTWALYKTIQKEGSAKFRGKVPKTNIFDSAVKVALEQLRIGLLKQLKRTYLSNINTTVKSVKV